MRIRLNVTQKDIKGGTRGGTRGGGHYCPIANCLNKRYKDAVVGPDCFYVTTKLGRLVTGKLTKVASDFVRDFDSGKKAKPKPFKTTLTAEGY